MNCIKMRGTGHYGDTIYKCDICVGCDMHFVRDMFLRNVNVSPMDWVGRCVEGAAPYIRLCVGANLFARL